MGFWPAGGFGFGVLAGGDGVACFFACAALFVCVLVVLVFRCSYCFCISLF
jgi:hypothetical protein